MFWFVHIVMDQPLCHCVRVVSAVIDMSAHVFHEAHSKLIVIIKKQALRLTWQNVTKRNKTWQHVTTRDKTWQNVTSFHWARKNTAFESPRGRSGRGSGRTGLVKTQHLGARGGGRAGRAGRPSRKCLPDQTTEPLRGNKTYILCIFLFFSFLLSC